MLRFTAHFMEYKCKITVEYHCPQKETINLLYSQVFKRIPYEFHANFTEVEMILLDWKIFKLEIDNLFEELSNINITSRSNAILSKEYQLVGR